MQRYIFVRLVQGIFTLCALSLAVFLSVHLTGDPALYLLGPEGTQEDYEQLKKNMGLDKPLPVQYGLFLSKVVRGDFGNSHISGQPARKTLLERFPATLQLAGAAMALTVVVGLPLGILSAVKRDTVLDTFGKFFAILGIATPAFG
jgi:ABC-type dipeptide/oligopeptide/nickel transport system permease component